MGFGGGGGGTSVTQTEGGPIQNVPLQNELTGQGLRQLQQSSPFSYYGSGHQLMPQSPLGQVFAPGIGLSPKVQQTVDILTPILAEWIQSYAAYPAI